MNLILEHVDDNELIRRIDSAEKSVAIYTPGVSVPVAQALSRAAERLNGAVKVVFDVSQKSVDMGYLEPASVATIWTMQCGYGEGMFYHLSGLRFSSLFIDEENALIYAPVAKLMEDECIEEVMRCPSGLEVGEGEYTIDVRELPVVIVDEPMVVKICDFNLKPAKPLSEIRSDCERKIAEAEARVKEAEDRASEAEQRVKEAAEKAVAEYKKQFKIRRVEFSVRSQPAAIGRKRAQIPSMFLIGLGNDVEEKFSANYQLFPDETEIERFVAAKYPNETIATFSAMEKNIRESYLISVPKFGSYVQNSNFTKFNEEVEELKKLAKKVGAHIREAMNTLMDGAIEELYKVLADQWNKSRDPWFEEYKAKHPKEDRNRHDIFVAQMKTGAKGTDAMVRSFDPEVACFSTPIDEILANDPEFAKALEKVLWKRNHTEGVNKLYLEDLIDTKVKVHKKGDSDENGLF